jgi:hypothetical protein
MLPRELAAMFQLDRTSATPLADQIELRLRELVESGRLPPARACLPSASSPPRFR